MLITFIVLSLKRYLDQQSNNPSKFHATHTIIYATTYYGNVCYNRIHIKNFICMQHHCDKCHGIFLWDSGTLGLCDSVTL